jgi:ABC-2 type transport system permease protein
MNTMKWLVKREYWEHKGGFFWTPVIVSLIMTFFVAASLFCVVVLGAKGHYTIGDTNVTELSGALTPEQQSEAATALAAGYMGMSMPLFGILGFVVFFFFLGSLFDERKDRSVLFWKSLPISDTATVLSKIAIALIVAPLITLIVATLGSILMLLLMCITAEIEGLHVFGQVLSNPSLYLAPFQVAAILPVYILWALPTVGWLMMVSAWARTKPFLWAVGVPVLTGVLLMWFNAMAGLHWNTDWFWENIVLRCLLSVVPGTWFAHNGITNTGNVNVGMHEHSDMGTILTQSWHAMATADMWIGVAAGAAMIYAAIRLRRWRDEG